MSRLPYRQPVFRKSRRGVAILITLGILSLLLILAMGFLFNASTGKMGANNGADAIRAKLLADSALQRFVSMVGRDIAAQPNSNMNPAVSFYPGTGTWAGRRYVASIGSGALVYASTDSPLYAKIAGYDFTQPRLDGGLARVVKWVNVTTLRDTSGGAGTSFTDTRLVGRYAFLAVDETGKIDPGAAITVGTNESIAGGDTGVNFEEINLGYAFGVTSPTVDNFRTLLGTSPRWDSWYHMLRSGTLASPAEFTEASTVLFPHSREIEAFADPTDTSIAKHRFDLSQNAAWWNGASYTALTAAATNYGDSTGGIQWLTGGDTVASHIAMNLKDYCDADDSLTTDGAVLPAWPAFTGNERVPAINEIEIKVLMPSAFPGNAEVTFSAEFVNLYASAFSDANAELYLVADFADGATTFSATATINLSGQSFPATSYVVPPPFATSLFFIAAAPSALKVTAVRAMFRRSGGEVWDVAVNTNNSAAGNMAADAFRHIFCGVNDPRINELPSQWSWTAWANDGLTPRGAPAPTFTGARNSQVDFTGGDTEPATAIDAGSINISTAYIGNAPMKSLWELGAIHRGNPWQTINLSACTNGNAATIGNYANGDGNILDHVKLTNEEVVDGKLNANSKYEMAWRTLIGHIRLGASYAAPASGSTAINVTAWSPGNSGYDLINELATGIIATNGAFTNRGQIASVINLSNDTTTGAAFTNDAAKEELVGKIAHHLTTRSNWYSVIVCAQALHPTSPNIKVLAESKMLAIVYRDAFTGKTRVEYVQPLDE